MKYYDLVTLTCPPLTVPTVSPRAREWALSGHGTLFGIFRSEIGRIGQMVLFRGFDSLDELATERERSLVSTNPFGVGSTGTMITYESYKAFDFLPPVAAATYGGLYEFRTYHLKAGGLPDVLLGWCDAVGPAEDYTRHLVTNMYALDGVTRITHIWGFSSLDERNKLRADHYARKLWPPLNGPENIDTGITGIFMAEPGLPLA